PLSIVEDRGFQSLMNTGRPEYYIPSHFTVSCDVCLIFAQTRNCEYDGKVNFTTDAWMAPNHRAFIAFSVHLAHKGEALTMPLDIIEVARSHTGLEMATVFAKILEDFRLMDKV
ncbi:hypothetical protein PAXRUDRAFT_148193, partial [Paxillus rubicundulus Ve08.2h10]